MTASPRVAIVCDSTADLSEDLRARLGITMVPLNVHFGTDVFRDQLDLTTAEFTARLGTAREPPTTSQPAAGQFESVFRDLAATHDGIVCVLLSAGISGAVGSAQIAAEQVKDTIPVEVVDSESTTMGCGFQVLRAVALAAEGLSAIVIAQALRGDQDRYHVIFFVDSLDYLRRSGRVGRSAALLGSVIQLKPLLRFDEGVVVPFERTRTRRKAIDALVRFTEHLPGIERICAIHNTTPDDAAALMDRVGTLGRLTDAPRVVTFGSVLGAHVGTGVLGLAIEGTPHE